MAGKNNKKFGFVLTGMLIAFLTGGSLLCGQLLSERKCFTVTIAEDSRNIKRLSGDNKELADGNQALGRRNGVLRTELKYTQEKIRGQEIKIKRLEEESVKTRREVDELKEGLYMAKAIVDQLTEKVEKLNGAMAKLERDNKALEVKAILPQNP
jgi:chromosome segregation ATPase